ncbi:MAG: hypothetical protein M1815_003800, partial [Lichina confinis]
RIETNKLYFIEEPFDNELFEKQFEASQRQIQRDVERMLAAQLVESEQPALWRVNVAEAWAQSRVNTAEAWAQSRVASIEAWAQSRVNTANERAEKRVKDAEDWAERRVQEAREDAKLWRAEARELRVMGLLAGGDSSRPGSAQESGRLGQKGDQ